MKFATDIAGHKWVIIADNRRSYKPTPECAFCPGQENLNKELLRVGTVRVIANKYPRTDWDEVIIHSPDHLKDIDELPIEQVALLLRVYQERYNFHKNHGQVFIFQNHDLYAGASLPHPHSQLIVIPKEIPVEPAPLEPIKNIVLETDYFTAFCPDFSQWPYEVWLAPKEAPNQTFGESSDPQLADLAAVLQKILQIMVVKFEINKEMVKKGTGPEFPYNFYIYHRENWYLRIIPRLMRHGGFELSTGLHINTVDPATAAEELRKETNGQ